MAHDFFSRKTSAMAASSKVSFALLIVFFSCALFGAIFANEHEIKVGGRMKICGLEIYHAFVACCESGCNRHRKRRHAQGWFLCLFICKINEKLIKVEIYSHLQSTSIAIKYCINRSNFSHLGKGHVF